MNFKRCSTNGFVIPMGVTGKTFGEIAREYVADFSQKVGVPSQAYLIGSSVEHVDEFYDGRRDIDILIVTDRAGNYSLPILEKYRCVVHQIDFLPGMLSIKNFLKGRHVAIIPQR